MSSKYKIGKHYRWEHVPLRRYYLAVIQQNLFMQWEVVRVWGHKDSSLGRVVVEPCETINDAFKVMELIKKKRRQRSYITVA